MWIAYCFANGFIGFGEEIPAGALPICAGRKNTVEEVVSVKARHTRVKTWLDETGELLVPGIPEAEGEDAALDALFEFQAQVYQAGQRKAVPLVHGQHLPVEVEEAVQ